MARKRESRVVNRESGAEEVSPSELARLSGYTKTQVLKWLPAGLKVHARTQGTGRAKRVYIQRDKGLAWIKGNAVGVAGAHGGKRSGSGRRGREHAKKKPESGKGKAQGIEPSPVQSDHLSQGERKGEGAGKTPSTIGAVIDPPKASPRRLVPPRPLEAASFGPGAPRGEDDDTPPDKPWEAMTQPEKLAYLQSKTAVEVKQFLDSQKILSEELARAEKERTLISIDEAKEIWTDICSTAANQLDGAREAISSRLLTELGLPSSAKARIRAILEQEQAKFITTLRGCAYAGAAE